MNSFFFVVCLLPLAIAGWGSQEENMGMDYQKWQEKEKSEKMTYMEKFTQFLQFKEKMMKMKEMEKKKAVFEEFMHWKMAKAQKEGQMKDEQEDNEMKEHAGKFEMVLNKMKSDNKKEAKMIVHAFLGLCKCSADMGIMDMFKDKKDGWKQNGDDNMGKIFEGDMPDFMGNNTAKAHFLKSLSKEQQKEMFGYGLVKSMCKGAKTFIAHAKMFEETYMKEDM